MDLKKHRHLIIFLAAATCTLIFYFWFIQTPYFEDFKIWSEANIIIYVSVLLLIKITGIIWPPLPGGIFTIASIPILGWQLAYAIDFTGSMIGSTGAFFIAKKWGNTFVQKIFDKDIIDKISKIKVRKSKEIESVFLMRFFGGTILEIVCYGAGLFGIGYRNFLIGSILSHLPLGMPIFYFAGNILNGKGALLSLIFILFVIFLFYKLRNRYFEYQ